MPLFLLFPGIIFAKANYVRSFANPSVSSSIVVNIAVNDYDEDINCGGLKFWGIQAIEHKTGNRFFGNPRFVSSAILSQTFTLDLPAGDYEETTFICSDDGEDEVFQFWSIENDLAGDEVIFSVPAPTIDIIDSGATPAAPLPDSAPVDSISTPESEATTSPVSAAETSTSSESIIGVVIDAFSNLLGL